MYNFNIFCSMIAIASLVLVGLITPATCQEENPVYNVCLRCSCEGPINDVCGIFRISWIHSTDKVNSTVNKASPETKTAFEYCAFNSNCTTQTVQKYVQTFKEDCNGDRKQHCYDYATIRRLGGADCPNRIVQTDYRVLNQCLLPYDEKFFNVTTYNDRRYLQTSKKFTTKAMPSLDVKQAQITSEKPSKTFSGQSQKKVSEMKQILKNDDSVQNFDYSVTIPPLSVFELVRAKENTTSTTPLKSNKLPQLPPPDSDDSIQNFDYSVNIPPLSVFELVRAKENTTTVRPDIKLRGQNSTNGTHGPELRSHIIESSQDRKPNKMDRMVNPIYEERSRRNFLSLEAFLNSTRIENEEHEILKEITANIKQIAAANIQLKVQAIKSKQEHYLNILQRLENSQKLHNDIYLRNQKQFLEATLKQNRIEEDRNAILKEIAENIQKLMHR